MNKDYDVNDLLDLIGDTDSITSPEPILNELDRFLFEIHIKKGVDRIPNYVIFYLYKEKFGGEMSKIGFFRKFNKLFEAKRTGKQRVYMLDKSSIELTEEDEIRLEMIKNETK